MCVLVDFAINLWVTASDVRSGYCHGVVVPEHVGLWEVAGTMYLVLCLSGDRWGALVHHNCAVSLGQSINGIVNFIRKKEGHFIFNCRYRKNKSCVVTCVKCQ